MTGVRLQHQGGSPFGRDPVDVRLIVYRGTHLQRAVQEKILAYMFRGTFWLSFKAVGAKQLLRALIEKRDREGSVDLGTRNKRHFQGVSDLATSNKWEFWGVSDPAVSWNGGCQGVSYLAHEAARNQCMF